MNNVVQLRIIELQKLIRTANKTRKLKPLLDAIRLACREKTNFAPVTQASASEKNDFEPVSFPFRIYLNYFCGTTKRSSRIQTLQLI